MPVPRHFPDLPTLAERLRWLRDRAGKLSSELSIDAGLSHGTVSRLETKPGADIEARTAFKLAELLSRPSENLAEVAQWLACGRVAPMQLPRSDRGTKAGRTTGRKPKNPAPAP